jgi:hypothetical protein
VDGAGALQDPAMPFMMIGAAAVFMCVFIWRTRTSKRKDPYNIQPKIAGHKILDTGDRWLWFTISMALAAFAAHILAEYTFHLYDVTPVDKFTHGLSGMAITAFILNFNLTRGRKVYYPVSIGVSWLAFVAWEIYEWIAVMTIPNSGIETSLWDMGIDLWIDTLGALAICFFYDELMHDDHEQKT